MAHPPCTAIIGQSFQEIRLLQPGLDQQPGEPQEAGDRNGQRWHEQPQPGELQASTDVDRMPHVAIRPANHQRVARRRRAARRPSERSAQRIIAPPNATRSHPAAAARAPAGMSLCAGILTASTRPSAQTGMPRMFRKTMLAT